MSYCFGGVFVSKCIETPILVSLTQILLFPEQKSGSGSLKYRKTRTGAGKLMHFPTNYHSGLQNLVVSTPVVQ